MVQRVMRASRTGLAAASIGCLLRVGRGERAPKRRRCSLATSNRWDASLEWLGSRRTKEGACEA